ncbi:MAG: ABC transporter ATP-binding protein [Deltaproteobacteria bacterium]|nr:ABC transporter ATP-binding protein [Deltaproteobacteria bacterium]
MTLNKKEEISRKQVESNPSAIVCSGVRKYFQEVRAVDGVDLEVRKGECFGLLGPNGAGKTTLVEIIEGLTKPDAGSVEILGYFWGTGNDHAIRERIAVQLQETQLADKLTVEETIRLFRSFFSRGHSVEEVIILGDLEEKRRERVHKLSGGTKQRLALACALVSDPEILFLDEPTTGLDPQARAKVWDAIEGFKLRGGTVVLTTHYMEEAARLCERVAIMDHGRFFAIGTPAELVASLGARDIIEFNVHGNLEADILKDLPGVKAVERKNEGYILKVLSLDVSLPALLSAVEQHQAKIGHLLTRQATLEDVFMSMAGGSLSDER